MSSEYNHKKIETKWQDYWQDNNLYQTPKNPDAAAYILTMFPYPSGSGLHVGHVESYTGTDVYSRFMRMQGVDVLYPMGWDAFGLPAENYAIKTGVHPRKKTDEAVGTFKNQINRLGLSYDWDREINTSQPEYYKWTQWLFTELFKNDLAEKQPAKVNWCSSCQTVLANEQVVDGECERCDTTVEQKDMDQWFFSITDYADQLIDDLDNLDWPESTKESQRNWIGRQQGARFSFSVEADSEEIYELEVFTTRPETLYGATFMVVAPEHELVSGLLADNSTLENKDDVATYVEEAKAKTERERKENKDKTGEKLEGIAAVNPASGESIPVFVADYVLADYGTGAIMAVPAHDERDHAFAEKFGVEIRSVINPETDDSEENVWTGEGEIKNSDTYNGLDSSEAAEKITEKFGEPETTYRLRDWSVGRQRFWGCPIPIVYDPEGKPHPVPEEHLPWTLPEDVPFEPTGEPPLAQSEELQKRTEKIFGDGWTPEVETLDTFVDSSWYFLRYTDPHNENEFADPAAIADWCPVDMYVGGAEHSVMHLLYARFITKALADIGHVNFREPFSSLRHQGMVLAEDGTKMSKSKGNVVNPNTVVDQVGADTLRMYELFAGPFSETIEWNTDTIAGPRRFLERVWRMAQASKPADNPESVPVDDQLLHKTIKDVTEDVADFKFNTAISSLMELANDFRDRNDLKPAALATLTRLLAPFAPHITEELWQMLGGTPSIHQQPWPDYDAAIAEKDTVTIAIQIDGTVRGEVKVSKSADEEVVIQTAKEHKNVASWLEGETIVREIYVPGRLVNLVTG